LNGSIREGGPNIHGGSRTVSARTPQLGCGAWFLLCATDQRTTLDPQDRDPAGTKIASVPREWVCNARPKSSPTSLCCNPIGSGKGNGNEPFQAIKRGWKEAIIVTMTKVLLVLAEAR
jgi:hypothetical protein